MNLLAIESSASLLSVAVLAGETLYERSGATGISHSEQVLPLVDAVLNEAGVSLARLDAVAFGAGPGAFTGLRLACSVAQGIAFAYDLPVVGVGSLEALAFQCARPRVIACVDARMNEVYCAAYEVSRDGVVTVMAPVAAAPGEVPLPPEGGWFACGDGLSAYGAAALARLHAVVEGSDASLVARAGAVARLAAPRAARGEGVDAALAAPAYVRDKVAFTTAERLERGGKA